MRLTLPLLPLLLLALLWPPPASAQSEVLVGTITSTGASVTAATTAVPFTTHAEASYLVQCDAAAYIDWVAATDAAVSAATGLLLPAGATWDTGSGRVLRHLAVISVSGTANCKVWRVRRSRG